MRRRSRRHFIRASLALSGLGLLAGCGIFPPQAQAPPKVHRIGLLLTGSPESTRAHTESLRQGLRELGYVEGQNAVVADLHRRAAGYVDKILKGTKPGDLPIEQPTRFDFVVNLKTAQAIGLTIPQSVLLQATELIQ